MLAPVIELVSTKLVRKPINVKNDVIAEGLQKQYKDSTEIHQLLEEIFQMSSLSQEHFVLITLNVRMQVTAISTISIGTSSMTLVSPKDVFTTALLNHAEAIVIAHNHPSGEVLPSQEDINVTKRLVECGKLLDIQALDHLIIGNNKYYSLKEQGMM